jgi:hypothetical protein
MDIQWARNGNIVVGNAGTYTVQLTDTGSTLAVTVTRSGNSGSVTSNPTGRITLPWLSGTVSITGTVQVGQILTANTTNLVGIPGAISYQWRRGGIDIFGATASTYTVVIADVGSDISVTVTRANNLGSVTSNSTDRTEFSTLTGFVGITGTAHVGAVLTANTTNLGGSGTISYQWRRGTSNISGATGSTYTIQAADAGSSITVVVTRAQNTGSVTSNPTSVVTLSHLTGSVSITGAPLNGIVRAGQMLSANTANLGGSGTISYQWMRQTDLSVVVPISGATNSWYTIQSADVNAGTSVAFPTGFGSFIYVVVTRANNTGSVRSNEIFATNRN